MSYKLHGPVSAMLSVDCNSKLAVYTQEGEGMVKVVHPLFTLYFPLESMYSKMAAAVRDKLQSVGHIRNIHWHLSPSPRASGREKL